MTNRGSASMHALDLPLLKAKPDARSLMVVIDDLKVDFKNFDQPETLKKSMVMWLTRLVANDLEWLDEESAEMIRAKASARLAQNGGPTSRPAFIREFTLESDSRVIRIHEPGMVGDYLGFKTWGSALVLANRILAHPCILSGNVLELGAGTGLCGIAASLVHNPVHLTDLEEIIANLAQNIRLNNSNASCSTLDWSQPSIEGLPSSFKCSIGTVILSDPVYVDNSPKLLRDTLKLLRPRRILLQLPLRQRFDDLRSRLRAEFTSLQYTIIQEELESGQDDWGEVEFQFTLWEPSQVSI